MSSSASKRETLANQYKDKGNNFFSIGKFREALECYQDAISLLPNTNAIFHSNASQCCINIKEYDRALDYAKKAVEIDPTHVKSITRRAVALKALKRYTEALEDFQHASQLEPNNKDIKAGISSVLELISIQKSQTSHKNENTQNHEDSNATLMNDHLNLTQSTESKLAKLSVSPNGRLKKETLQNAQEIVSKIPTLPDSAPNSFHSFESIWKSIRSHPNLIFDYYKMINPQDLPNLFKDLMTADMLVSFIQCIELYLISEVYVEQGLAFLRILPTLPRFSLLRMFLNPQQKEDLESLFELIRESNLLKEEERSELKMKYGI